MNCNYYWPPQCLNYLPQMVTNFYFQPCGITTIQNCQKQKTFQELKKKCQQLELENQKLKQQVNNLQQNSQSEKIKFIKLKRIIKRRKQQELQKKYHCCFQNCKKQYASSLALNLHMKTKHFKQFRQRTGRYTRQSQSNEVFQIPEQNKIKKNKHDQQKFLQMSSYNGIQFYSSNNLK